VKTSTVEETQPQPTVTIIEQQETITEQPVTTEEKKVEEEQTITTTTEVEQQPILQVKADASATQPKTEEQVSVLCFVVLSLSCAVLSLRETNRLSQNHLRAIQPNNESKYRVLLRNGNANE
jgi:hypothetical protein